MVVFKEVNCFGLGKASLNIRALLLFRRGKEGGFLIISLPIRPPVMICITVSLSSAIIQVNIIFSDIEAYCQIA